MDGKVEIVPFLQAPGFIKAETSPGEKWPDISSCTGLRLHVRGDGNYTGYRVSFGRQHPPDGFPYSYGYKTDLHLSGSTEMENIVLNFDEFSYDWDAATGDQKTTCAENTDNCPSIEALQDIFSIALWAEGVEGDVHLVLASIYAVGCDDYSSDTDKDTASSKEEPARTSNGSEEIIIENFAKPRFSWSTLNDPVMGGQSDAQISLQDGVVYFYGHVKIVSFLQVPGFITLVNSRGDYPDVSSCDALKLVLKSQEAYSGYYVSFGSAHVEGNGHAFGFKAHFDAPVQDGFISVVLPFSTFSNNWNDGSGAVEVSCEEESKYCPDRKTLQNFETMSVWGEGVEGTINLMIKEISAVGCGDDGQLSYSSPKAHMENGSYFNFAHFTTEVGIAVTGAVLATAIFFGIRQHLSSIKKQYGRIEEDLRFEVEKTPVLHSIS